jgi:hypothetical protein
MKTPPAPYVTVTAAGSHHPVAAPSIGTAPVVQRKAGPTIAHAGRDVGARDLDAEEVAALVGFDALP